MTFWSGETIIAAGPKIIQPFNSTQIDCASYKLSMGREVYITPQKDGMAPPYGDKLSLSKGQSIWIPPGQFAFLLTNEYLKLPKDVLGFISLATQKKYNGLVNVSGFHVDPGFQGNLVFAVYNAGPKKLRLAEGECIFLIWFANLDNPHTLHNRIEYKKKPQTEIAADLVQNIRGIPVTLQTVAEDLESLKSGELKSIRTQLTIYSSIAAATAIIFTVFCGFLAVDWGGVYEAIHGKGVAETNGAQPTSTTGGSGTSPAHPTNNATDQNH